MPQQDDLARGRAAYADRSWASAFELLSSADGASSLGAEDLEMLATTAYLRGHYEVGLEALSRAYTAYVRVGAVDRAAGCAYWSAFASLNRGEHAQAQGWASRAMTLLDDHDVDCVERGYLEGLAGIQLLMRGEHEAALERIRGVLPIARRFEDANLRALGTLGIGQALIARGDSAEGVAMLDEVMVSATSGELTETVAGLAYCAVIAVCQNLFDARRAREWTAALSRWCADQPDLVPYSGHCLVHRAEILRFEGDWLAAADATEAAHARYALASDWASDGLAFYEEAELLRLRGHLDAAEQAYLESSRHGRDPQPGLALLRVAQGKAGAAATASRRFVQESHDRLRRARMLAAHVEILVAADEVDEAFSAGRELDEIAVAIGAPMLSAIADRAVGLALLARGDSAEALGRLRSAVAAWRDLDAPYELARTRELVAVALDRLADAEGAALERVGARSTYEALGAEPDLARLDRLSTGVVRVAVSQSGLTDREVEVLRLVASGRTNRAIATELVLSEKTVARHVSNIFVKLDVSSRSAATAFAYENGLV